MARFDAYRMADSALVVDCQADLLSHLKTRLVVPLLSEADVTQPIRKLNPMVHVAGTAFYFCADLAAAVPLSQLRERVGSLKNDRDSLSAALDMLLIGF
jgi:toxin CcdB